MKAKIYYQDFDLNSRAFFNAKLRINKEAAALMAELEFDVSSKAEFCKEAFREMNIGKMISTPAFQKKVCQQPWQGKHTSMSIGDYVKFEDGEIWMIAPIGYRQFPAKE
jgi:hypothetical protein